MWFCILSSEYSPILLQRAMLDFIDTVEITPKTFEEYKRGLISMKSQGHTGILSEAKYLTSQLTRLTTVQYKDIVWDFAEQQVAFLGKLSYKDFKAFFAAMLLDSKPESGICDIIHIPLFCVDRNPTKPEPQVQQRKYLTLRCFSKKFKEEITCPEMEQEALEGNALVSATIPTFLPNQVP